MLDLFCGEGGAAKGYKDAGFYVVGVDLNDHSKRYAGDEFHQGGAIEYLKGVQSGVFDYIHASPPCQRYSLAQRLQGNEHPDLIAPTREACERTGVPYIIENVCEARDELINPQMLCGVSFGLHTKRHRLFEYSSYPWYVPLHPTHSEQCKHINTVKMGRSLKEGDYYHAVGNFSSVPYVREDMQVPWMSRDGIRECIPPAYTKFIGNSIIAHIRRH